MAISTTDKELLEYFSRLDEPQKKSLIELIRTFLKNADMSFGPVSIEQYNKELEEAMERVKKGDFTTMEELEKEMETW